MATATQPEVTARYEPVIGLEVHVQLATATKIFCGCSTRFGAPPNSQTCPVCLGMPGALPVLNRAVVSKAAQAALGLGCRLNPVSVFARKNYFYPDLPKGYQISQYDRPLAQNGELQIRPEGAEHWKRIGITRVHLEEDAGKNLHDGVPGQGDSSCVDFNRSGVPLIEIVSEPDLRSPQEAFDYLTRLKEIMLYLEVSDCNMEEGSLRCDANVSLRPRGASAFGAKVEVKNLNSFRFLQRALEHEIERQAGVLDAGGRIPQETRLFDASTGQTRAMRSKEEAHDYRYFPEPDLPPLTLDAVGPAGLPAGIEALRAALPELPQARRDRLQAEFGLSAYDAGVLTSSRALADYYEEAARGSAHPKAVANWVMGELSAVLKAGPVTLADVAVRPRHIVALVELVEGGTLSGKLAKDVFAAMARSGEMPGAVVERLGLKQISDSGELEALAANAIAAFPKQAAEYRAGKTPLLAFFVGQVMKASRGQANPGQVNEVLRRLLG